MADIAVTITTPRTLSANDPNAVINLTFTYAGSTTPSKQQIYYAATLQDNASTPNTESVVFPFTITPAGPIPASEAFAFTPTKLTGDTVTLVANSGAIYYTA